MLDRRQLLTGVVGGLFGSLVLPRRSAAQQVGHVELNDRLSLVTTGGTNVLALSTAEASFSWTAVRRSSATPHGVGAAVLIRRSRQDTVQHALASGEHRGRTARCVRRGATIVAHENTRLWMATPTWMPDEDRYRPPRTKDAQPDKTFYVDGSMTAGSERIDYGYLIEAHTSGDIYVFFRDSNVLAVGDVASPSRDPELDYLTGAWIGGRVDAMDRLLKLADANTRIVPGFGPVMTRAELQTERDVMKPIYDRTVDRVREGDYVEDMLKAGVMNGLARTWKDPQKFLHDLHKGLWAHHNKLDANVV